MPTPDYHARLSPSSAKRWLNCPASIKLSASIPPTTSRYAEAGRIAHSIAELKARRRFTVLTKRSYSSQLKKLQETPEYSPEMDRYTDIYVETLEQHAMSFQNSPFIALEISVPVGVHTGENKPDGSPASGTADCIQIAEDTLWITDYKNGAGVPVDAENNPQMMLYGLGALTKYSIIYGEAIKTVKMSIVQPALNSVSDWSIPRVELEAWGKNILRPGADRAVSADPGEPNPDQDPNGWCRFCPAKPLCRGRADKVLALEAFGNKLPPTLSDAEVGDALTRGASLAAWYNDLKDYALAACLAGKDIPGYKVVAGRTARDWDDLDTAFAELQARGVAEAFLWERKPASVAGLEKTLGKKAFETASAGHVVAHPGKPTLVEIADKRPPYSAAASAFEVI